METAHNRLPGQCYDKERTSAVLEAVLKLRDELLRIEGEHAFLRNELSTVCDDFMAQINHRSVSQEPQAEQISRRHEDQSLTVALNQNTDQAAQDTITHKSNLISSSINSAGNYLESGLDKAGDSIIFLFEALLKLNNSKADIHLTSRG